MKHLSFFPRLYPTITFESLSSVMYYTCIENFGQVDSEKITKIILLYSFHRSSLRKLIFVIHIWQSLRNSMSLEYLSRIVVRRLTWTCGQSIDLSFGRIKQTFLISLFELIGHLDAVWQCKSQSKLCTYVYLAWCLFTGLIWVVRQSVYRSEVSQTSVSIVTRVEGMLFNYSRMDCNFFCRLPPP